MPWYYNLDVFCDILSQLHMLEGEPQHIDAEMLAPEARAGRMSARRYMFLITNLGSG
jgi:hypothetical protein